MTAPSPADRLGRGRRPGRPPAVLTGLDLVLGVLALAAEIILFAGLAQLAHKVAGGGWGGVLAAVVVLGAAAVAWGMFMAPTSARRLSATVRTLVCAVAGLAIGGGLSSAGWLLWGGVVLATGLVLAGLQWTMGRRERKAAEARAQAEAARTDCFPGVDDGGTA